MTNFIALYDFSSVFVYFGFVFVVPCSEVGGMWGVSFVKVGVED